MCHSRSRAEPFPCRWLNRCPTVQVGSDTSRDELLLDADAWPELTDYAVGQPAAPTAVVVETATDGGGAH